MKAYVAIGGYVFKDIINLILRRTASCRVDSRECVVGSSCGSSGCRNW